MTTHQSPVVAAFPTPDVSERYVVIGWNSHDRYNSASMGLFEVHVAKGETTKDVQDKVAADLATDLPHIIYTVVLEQDYRQIWRDRLNHFFGREVA